jgi:transposase
MIARTDPILYKEYVLKERFRLALKQVDEDSTKQEIDSFFWRYTHSEIPILKNLAYKIRRHENNILNTVKTNLSNARIEV